MNKWINLKPPLYKINSDGAVFQQQQASGVGVVIRDHAGRVVATLSKKLHYPFGLLETEAKAFEEFVDFTWDVGVQDVHFECDSLMLSNAIEGLSCRPIAISNIVSVICHRLHNFRFVQVSHVRREGNKPVHILAQYAKDLVSYVI